MEEQVTVRSAWSDERLERSAFLPAIPLRQTTTLPNRCFLLLISMPLQCSGAQTTAGTLKNPPSSIEVNSAPAIRTRHADGKVSLRGLAILQSYSHRSATNDVGTADYFNYTTEDGKVLKDIAWFVHRSYHPHPHPLSNIWTRWCM